MESKDKDLIFAYINNVIMVPLIKISGSIGATDFETALRFERTTILCLPPEWKKEFEGHLKCIDKLLRESNLFSEEDPIQFNILRREYFKQEGQKIALIVYDKLWSFVHDNDVFENLSKPGAIRDPTRDSKVFTEIEKREVLV